mgnify:CR=1 FL=1
MNCIIDGTVDEKYLALGLWGKPVIFYPISNAIDSGCFELVYVVTKSGYIEYLVKEFYDEYIAILQDFPEEGLVIDGRAANVTKESIQKAVVFSESNRLTNIFDFCNNPEEIVLVDNSNNFELSLVLCNKRNKPKWLRKMILNRISEKEDILLNSNDSQEICLVGHSQFDQWEVSSLCSLQVRNCGISGITTREYIDDIVDTGKLSLGFGPILVLLGINDVAKNRTVDEIAEDIFELLDKLCRKTSNQVFCLGTLHINGRLDRDNIKVDELNEIVKKNVPSRIKWISTNDMDDPYGYLNFQYTTDGLHLNKLGYEVLRMIIEREVRI